MLVDKQIKHTHAYFVVSLCCAFIAIIVFDVMARIDVAKEALGRALSESLYYSVIQPLGTAFLLSPFLASALIASLISRNGRGNGGWLTLFFGVAPLEVLYLLGNFQSQQLMLQEKWTAATLAIGFLPFQSIPVLAVSLTIGSILALLLDKGKGSDKSDHSQAT